MGDVGLARYEPALLPPLPNHKGFKLQDTRYKMILLSFHVYNYTYIRHISQDNSHDN